VKVVYAPWKSAADGLELIQGENFPEGLQAEYFETGILFPLRDKWKRNP